MKSYGTVLFFVTAYLCACIRCK